MKPSVHYRVWGALTALLLAISFLLPGNAASAQQGYNPDPPDHTVKLIFIHHSTGENWLRDDYGGLGQALADNNYFVSDTNYGWGPDSIGDRTDIPDWTEWFASGQTPVYMDALFNESGQNSGYTRRPSDPGGENQIILFKSCFPNSALEGSPDDPPSADGWLTVGHAKYVYNEILQYFATRPDKLFVVITAPPLSDSTYADNARAFNQWLVNDWLDENNYTLPNVAVFDFYNILTARDAHHRYNGGVIEHTYGSSNTLAYPSGDDHPSEAGSRKATEEFLPLLNIFYHRWADGQPSQPPAATQPPAAATGSPVPPVAPGTPGLITDFDGNDLAVSRWDTYLGEAAGNRFTCSPSGDAAYSGSSSLKADFDIAAGSWGTCVLSFDQVQDWSAGQGLAFFVHASQPGLPYNVVIYAGTPEAQETYIESAETPQDSLGGWALVEIPWAEFKRADWEADAGATFTKSGQILSIAFGFDGLADSSNTGTIWIDDIQVSGAVTSPITEPPGSTPEPDGHGTGVPCLGSILFSLVMVSVAWVLRRK